MSAATTAEERLNLKVFSFIVIRSTAQSSETRTSFTLHIIRGLNSID